MTAPTKRTLALATLGALAAGTLVLLAFVMPAEYGIDPLGVGGAFGLLTLNEEPEPLANDTTRVLTTYPALAVSATKLHDEAEGKATTAEAVQVQVPVSAANILSLRAVVSWTDAENSEPDTFEVQWTGPDGKAFPSNQARNADSGSGSVTTVALVSVLPQPDSLEAAEPAQARSELDRRHPASTLGQGTWTLTIRLTDAPGALGLAPDGENSYRVQVFLETFSWSLGAAQSAPIVEHTVTIRVPPQRSLEYKFRVDEGHSMTYKWQATGELSYDFHGDRTDGSGGFATHEKGTAAMRSGDFVAPFDGKHGWYWLNRGVSDVVLTLETRGQFTVIGFV